MRSFLLKSTWITFDGAAALGIVLSQCLVASIIELNGPAASEPPLYFQKYLVFLNKVKELGFSSYISIVPIENRNWGY